MRTNGKLYRSLNIRLDSSLHDRLDNYVQKTGISKTTAVERILDQYLSDWEQKRKEGRTDVL